MLRYVLGMTTLLLALSLLVACSTGSDTPNPMAQPESTDGHVRESEPVEITIGVISDRTGMAAQTMGIVDIALDDLVGHFNSEGLIPGLTLSVITYDGQYHPARDIPGYEWLSERGADVIFADMPNTAVTLKPRADADRMVVFSLFASQEVIEDPGWVFCMNIPISAYATTLLDWVARNHWDSESNGPARVGTAGWTGPL